MEKKLLSGLTALIVAAQGFGVPVLAAAPAEVIGAARDIDKVIVSFDKDPGDIGAAVLASDMKDTGIVAEKDTDKLVISTDELAAGTYYLRVDAAKTKLYEFKINEMNYSQVSRHKKAHFFRGAGYFVCSQYKASASFGVSILSVPCGLFVL